MYKHNDHYLKFCIPQRSIVLTIQKVNYDCRLEKMKMSPHFQRWWDKCPLII